MLAPILAVVQVAYASGWTGPNLATDINHKLAELHVESVKKDQMLEIKDIKISPEWGYAFIIYETINKADSK